MKLGKKKSLYTENKIVEETGEVIPKRWIYKQSISRENFVIMYIDDIAKLNKLSNASYRLLTVLAKYLEYNINEFYLNLKRKQELVALTGLKFNTISQSITRLVKKNLLIRVSNSTYQMNPLIFFKGEELERAKYLDMIIRYEICPECGEKEYKPKGKTDVSNK